MSSTIAPPRILLVGLLAVGTLLGGCGRGRDCIDGSGKVASETRVVRPFQRVELGGSIDMVITRADTQSVRVEGDDNLLDHVDTDVEADKLVAGFDGCFDSDHPITVYITAPDLRSVQLSGSGSIHSSGPIATPSMAVRMNGSGSIDLEVATQSVRTQGIGSGEIHLHGSTVTHDVVLDGSGSLDALDLASQRTTITLNGSGEVAVAASRELHATVTGSGDVRYRGAPAVLDINATGSGSVTPVDTLD